jgi:hypothetical protein
MRADRLPAFHVIYTYWTRRGVDSQEEATIRLQRARAEVEAEVLLWALGRLAPGDRRGLAKVSVIQTEGRTVAWARKGGPLRAFFREARPGARPPGKSSATLDEHRSPTRRPARGVRPRASASRSAA